SFPTGLPVATFQRRAYLSEHPVARVLASGLNATDETRSGCSRGCPTGLPDAVSQSWTGLPYGVARSRRLASGQKATPMAPYAGSPRRKGSPTGRDVVTSQRRAVPS